jgi:hypothetical protein
MQFVPKIRDVIERVNGFPRYSVATQLSMGSALSGARIPPPGTRDCFADCAAPSNSLSSDALSRPLMCIVAGTNCPIARKPSCAWSSADLRAIRSLRSRAGPRSPDEDR